ncbi:acyl carrier protein [Nocardia terpenica]|uniref:Carrier domain-containing protein n=1 Tax=Nocardia terpenica TaxID=455432 RepID=A0A6G9Z4X9_9NOCA|nr:acyl carrier protein [Nocardia terpenica]QIS20236.1 hypothetical protein F6W96_20020 [Nocardia terpenica]
MLSRIQLRDIFKVAIRYGVDDSEIGKPLTDDMDLSELGISSLELAEFTVRCEQEAGRELSLDIVMVRRVITVGDLLDLVEEMLVAR